ncbi:MAG: hypothetical protein LQ346_004840 [Caloplaca aetnensis]|nr:MAG: hypothetical protein LQ346_004840 [Caloplaca aetnensis]
MVATLPSDLALVASFALYRLIHRFAEGPNPSLPRLSAVIRATSTLHSSATTILAAYYLYRCRMRWAAAVSPSADGPTMNFTAGDAAYARQESAGAAGLGGRYPDDSKNPLLQSRSTLGNAITAIECGYLLQDTISLLREAGARRHLAQPRSQSTLRSLLQYADKTLLFHHVGIALALLVLHFYVHLDRERGIYIIVQFLLMNSSTPILNLRWWLRTYHPSYRLLGLGADFAFIAAFYLARIWLVGWIIRGYGKSHGYESAWKMYVEGMRLPCQLGTGALWVANSAWWALLVMSVVKRMPADLARAGREMHIKKG